jgi:hypothetical protein
MTVLYTVRAGLGCDLVVESLASLCEAMGCELQQCRVGRINAVCLVSSSVSCFIFLVGRLREGS